MYLYLMYISHLIYMLIATLTSPLVRLFVASLALGSPSKPPRTVSVVFPKEIFDLCVSIPPVTFCRLYSLSCSLDGRRPLARGGVLTL